MAKFAVNLYFPQSLTRDEALRRLKALPQQSKVSDDPEVGASGMVIWQIAATDHQYTADRIRRSLGMAVGDFYLRLTVSQPDDEDLLEKWDRITDLLEYGEDAVCLYQLSDILLIQKDGKLTLDSDSGYQSPVFHNHVKRRRQAEVKPLGCLQD
mgnify:FL=1